MAEDINIYDNIDVSHVQGPVRFRSLFSASASPFDISPLTNTIFQDEEDEYLKALASGRATGSTLYEDDTNASARPDPVHLGPNNATAEHQTTNIAAEGPAGASGYQNSMSSLASAWMISDLLSLSKNRVVHRQFDVGALNVDSSRLLV